VSSEWSWRVTGHAARGAHWSSQGSGRGRSISAAVQTGLFLHKTTHNHNCKQPTLSHCSITSFNNSQRLQTSASGCCMRPKQQVSSTTTTICLIAGISSACRSQRTTDMKLAEVEFCRMRGCHPCRQALGLQELRRGHFVGSTHACQTPRGLWLRCMMRLPCLRTTGYHRHVA